MFLLEERSAQVFLEQLVARLNLRCCYEEVVCLAFSGKNDLEKRLKKTIELWKKPFSRFVVLRDADSGDCRAIKQRLLEACVASGKADCCVVRIACRELESFFLGDLAAVERAFAIPDLAKRQATSKFRSPDKLGNPSQELRVLTKQAYSKVSGSERMGREIALDGSNRSTSFCVLLNTLLKLADGSPGTPS